MDEADLDAMRDTLADLRAAREAIARVRALCERYAGEAVFAWAVEDALDGTDA